MQRKNRDTILFILGLALLLSSSIQPVSAHSLQWGLLSDSQFEFTAYGNRQDIGVVDVDYSLTITAFEAIPTTPIFPSGFPRTTVSLENLEDSTSLDMGNDISSLCLSSFSAMPIGDWDYLSTVVEAYSLSTNPYDVAVVFATGQLGDKSFNDGVYSGMLDAVADFGIAFTYVEPLSISDYETFLRAYAQHAEWIEPYDLIICIGFDQEVALQTVANEFPNQKFAIVDMFIDPLVYPNVASLLFDEHEGSALVGAIAGLTTTTDKIGFVGGMDIPLIHKFAAGYLFGAGYVNPQLNGSANIAANFSIAFTNDWVDTTAAQTLADGMYDAGVDIVFASALRAGLGVIDSAKDKNATSSIPLWFIGVDSPQMYLGTADPNNPVPPTVTLTSMLKRVDVAVYNIIESWVIGGVWDTGFDLIYSFNLSNGGVGYEVNTDLLTLDPAIITAVEDFKALIIDGTVVVPDDYFWTLSATLETTMTTTDTTTETATYTASNMISAQETTIEVVAFGNTTHWGYSFTAENSTNRVLTTTVYLKESGIMEYFSGSHWSIAGLIMIEDVTIKRITTSTSTTTTTQVQGFTGPDTFMVLVAAGGVIALIVIVGAVLAVKRRGGSGSGGFDYPDVPPDGGFATAELVAPMTVEPEPIAPVVEDSPPFTGTGEVQALRGGEIVGGAFDYKVKVKNDTAYVINNVTVTVVAYPQDCMNLDGSSMKQLTRIEPGGFRSPQFKFTPSKDCVEGQVLATVSYVDHQNKIRTVEVEPFIIRSVCDLLIPLESSMEDFEEILTNMECTSEEHQLEWNPKILFEKAKTLLPSKNFHIVDKKTDTMAGEFIGTIRGFAEGKYTNKKVAVRIRISGNVDGNQSRLIIEGLGDDSAMLPTTIEELTKGIEAWICMNCGSALNPEEVSQIKRGERVQCRYCHRTLTIDLYRK